MTIRYIALMIKGSADVHWTESKSHTYEREFHVIATLDLSQNVSLRMPSQVEKIKDYCSWKCTTTPAFITVTIPKSGFLVNEEIPISVRISNKSTVDIVSIQTKLVKSLDIGAVGIFEMDISNCGAIAKGETGALGTGI
uniref:Arrestin C-terminal-like domain-containing protein n=1 Tax=Phlebotomus papatasi TaxID=29031 RepID=A0A1B0D7S0_PHLPP